MATGNVHLRAVVFVVQLALLLREGEGCYCPWSSWGSWSGCSVQCGAQTCGTRSFRHYPRTDCEKLGTSFESYYPGVTLSYCADRCCREPECLSFQYNNMRDCFLKRYVCSAWEKPYVAHGNMYDRLGVPETQYRTRTRDPCCSPSQQTQSSTCNTHSCCSCSTWHPWSSWSSCSRTCGGGTKTRTRTRDSCCSPSSDSETMSCNTQSCSGFCSCKWGNWHGWSTCSPSCGDGQQTRTRYRDYCCNPSHEEDTRPCYNYCDGPSNTNGGSATSFWSTPGGIVVAVAVAVVIITLGCVCCFVCIRKSG